MLSWLSNLNVSYFIKEVILKLIINNQYLSRANIINGNN